MNTDRARESALKALYRVETDKAYAQIALSSELEAAELEGIHRAFTTELFYGVLTRQMALDHVIAQFLKLKPSRVSSWVRNILRLGTWQILYSEKIPDSAAVNESVKLARRYSHQAAAGLVNGVLRNIVRNRAQLAWPEFQENPVKYMQIMHGFPEFLCQRWIGYWGPEKTNEILGALNRHPRLSVRINPMRSTMRALKDYFEEQGATVETSELTDQMIYLKNASDPSAHETFWDGAYYVQDVSSFLAVSLLDPQPGETILDLCSAPGGKATAAAELMRNQGKVIACDIHEQKLGLISSNARRLGITIIDVLRHDATAAFQEPVLADRVLLDAPCSGLGVCARKPDIKLRLSEDSMLNLSGLQRAMIRQAAESVKPGGVLMYSTCTLEPMENEMIVEQFLKENPDFSPDLEIPEKLLPNAEQGNGWIRFWPCDAHDGFFVSRMKKRGSHE